jgi:single-stranded-DNA-specific exonuclease
MTDLVKLLTEQEKDRYVVSKEEDGLHLLPDAFTLPGVEVAAKRVVKQLKKGKYVEIVGDYDVDGIMATTILYSFLCELGYENQVGWIVPDRFVDGYGISKNMIDHAIKKGTDIIITVDNGIGGKVAVDYAKENGIEVIITDHHTPGEDVPEVDIIVNPKYDLSEFPFMEISGATVAWYLCAGIQKVTNAQIDLRKWLDLVAITVISDVMPLKHINLIIYKYGLNMIKNKHRVVYEELFNVFQLKNINETTLGFQLVPMLNASGRIDHAKHAINLFLSKDRTFIKNKILYLREVNEKRKRLTTQLTDMVLPEAYEQINKGNKAIIVQNKNLHEGIVGIIAGKLAEYFKRPAFVIGWNEKKGIWKGSGRTSGNIHLYELLTNGAKHALGFGGHAGAVGVAIEKNNFESWKQSIVEAADLYPEELFFSHDENAIEIHLSNINEHLIEDINKFRPFGQEFKAPVFKTYAELLITNSYKDGLHWVGELIDVDGFSKKSVFYHDKRIGKLNKKILHVEFFPELIESPDGKYIQLDCKIPFIPD